MGLPPAAVKQSPSGISAARRRRAGCYAAFQRQHKYWLDDYALYQAIRAAHQQYAWFDWPVELRDRHPKALATARQQYGAAFEQCKFEQFPILPAMGILKRFANDRAS